MPWTAIPFSDIASRKHLKQIFSAPKETGTGSLVVIDSDNKILKLVAYDELAKNKKKFEVALIYLYDTWTSNYIRSEEEFYNAFKTMPWLALPFRDSSYKKLQRLFFFPWDFGDLDCGIYFIGPHMEFIQPFGLSILEEFKSPAYPFSCERVAELVTEEAKNLELKMLWDPDTVFSGNYGSKASTFDFQVKLDEFVGKRVIVLYDCCYGMSDKVDPDKIIGELIKLYEDSRGTDDEFEVIHIMAKSCSNEYEMKLPWIVELVEDCFGTPNVFELRGTYPRNPSLLAFDEDGKIVRKTIFPSFLEKEFPFYSGGMEKEALSQLIEAFEWNEYQERYPGTIYSYKKNRDSM